MQITRVDDLHQFDNLKMAWDAVYSADPHAHIFVSWAWLRSFFEVTPYHWFILGIRPDNGSLYVAFFPLAIQEHKFIMARVLRMGGAPMADYTGFVCLPEYEEQAIATFADYVQQQLGWDSFHMKDVLDPRLDLFLKSFSQKEFSVQHVAQISCPYIPLPHSWEQYLQEFLSSSTRKDLRKKTRRMESLNEFHVTHAQLDNLDSQIETLLVLWQARWGHNPDSNRVLLRRCFEKNCLWLTVLWQAATPITALAAFVDRGKKTFSIYINVFNDKFAKLSPGRVLCGYTIRYAIENGFKVYDFLRGDEAYKFSFASIERFNSHILVRRKTLRSRMATTAINLAKRLEAGKHSFSKTLRQYLGKRIDAVKSRRGLQS